MGELIHTKRNNQMAAPKLHPKLESFYKLMTKKMGQESVDSIVVKPSFKLKHISTGSTILNMLIGGSRLPNGSFICPGWPKGRIIEVYGQEGSGKSTIAMMGMGEAIRSGGTGLYVDLEHAVVDTYAMKLGCDFRPPEMGGSGAAIRVSPSTAEETQVIVNAAAIAGVDFIVIDSVAAMVPRAQAKVDPLDESDKAGLAVLPRFMSNWMPMLQSIIAKTGTIVIFLNQTRDKIGREAMMAFTEEAKKSTTGGNALKFYSSIRMMLKPKQKTKAKKWNPLIKDYQEVPIATDVQVLNVKNKIDALQGHNSIVTIRYGVGIDELRSMLNVSTAYDIVKMTKNAKRQEVYSFTSPTTGKVIEQISIEKFRSALSKDKVMLDEMISLCQSKLVSEFRAIDDSEIDALEENAVTTVNHDADDDMMPFETQEFDAEAEDTDNQSDESGSLSVDDLINED